MTAISRRSVHAPDHVAKSHLDFRVKSITEDSSGNVTIEGWANPATADRGKERVNPKMWDLDNFKKNPVLLFNHGKDPNYGMLPVGRVTAIEAGDQGLYAKAIISKSKDAKISVIRDLVSEKMLSTFSVGFDPGPEELGDDGITDVGGGQLLELSIVTIPMHQDAVFGVSSKDYSGMKAKLATAALKTKGAGLASYIQERMNVLQQEDGAYDRDAVLAAIGEAAGADLADVKNVLSGETVDVPAKLLSAFADSLALETSELKKLNDGDVEMAKKKTGGAEQPGATEKAALPPLRSDSPVTWVTDEESREQPKVDAEPTGEEKAVPPPPPETPTETPAAAPAPEAGDKHVVRAIIIPKSSIGSAEEAAKAVSAAGFKTDQASEDDDNYTFSQAPSGEFDEETQMMLDLGNGAVAQCAKPKAGAAAPPAPPAAADDGKQKAAKDPKEEPKDPAKAELEQVKEPQPPMPPKAPTKAGDAAAPAADACAACLSKAMKEGMTKGLTHSENRAVALDKCKAECPTEKDEGGGYQPDQLHAFCDGYATAHDHIKAGAVSQVAASEKSSEPTKTKQANQDPGVSTAIPNGSQDASTNDNPLLEISRQTNILLGTLINEIQQMSKKLDGKTEEPPQDVAEDAELAANIAKSLEMTQNAVSSIKTKIAELGNS